MGCGSSTSGHEEPSGKKGTDNNSNNASSPPGAESPKAKTSRSGNSTAVAQQCIRYLPASSSFKPAAIGEALKPFLQMSELFPQMIQDVETVLFEPSEIPTMPEDTTELVRKLLRKLKKGKLIAQYPELFNRTNDSSPCWCATSGSGKENLGTAGSSGLSDGLAQYIGCKTSADFVQAVRCLSVCVDVLLAESVAKVRQEALIDNCFPSTLPEEALPSDEDLNLCYLAATLLACLTEEAAATDAAIADAASSMCATELLWVLMSEVLRPSTGMHRTQMVMREVGYVHVLFSELGLQRPGFDPAEVLQQQQRPLWTGLPLFLIGISGRQALLYSQLVLEGQKKLVLSPVLRHDMLRSSAKSVAEFADAKSWKLFPVFQRRGVGIERGEGHGLRKEYFDGVAEDVTATFASPYDLTDYVRLEMTSRGSVNQQKLKLSWSTSHVRDSASLGVGDAIELAAVDGTQVKLNITQLTHGSNSDSAYASTSPRSGGDGSDPTTTHMSVQLAPDSPQHIVDNPAAAFGAAPSKVVFRKKVSPLFVMQPGQPYCWTNPSLPENSQTIRQEFYATGCVLANAPANGLPLSIPFAPLLFKVLFQAPQGKLSRFIEQSVTEEDLDLVFPGSADELTAIKDLPSKDFKELLEIEALDTSMSKAQYIHDIAICERLFPPNTREYMQAFLEGFHRSGLQQNKVLQRTPIMQLLAIFCGNVDDGESDFKFSKQFNFSLGEDFTETAHGRVFKEIFIHLVDEDLPSNEKRDLLQFITGRRYLPARPKLERISVEFPANPLFPRDFSRLKRLLPSSHSCDNVLDLPNYMEAVLFDYDGLWYDVSGEKAEGMVKKALKMKCWGELPDSAKTMAQKQCKKLLRTKLMMAVHHSSGYELDEGVVNSELQKQQNQDAEAQNIVPFSASPASAGSSGGSFSGSSPTQRGGNAAAGANSNRSSASYCRGGGAKISPPSTPGGLRRSISPVTPADTTPPAADGTDNNSETDPQSQRYNSTSHSFDYDATTDSARGGGGGGGLGKPPRGSSFTSPMSNSGNYSSPQPAEPMNFTGASPPSRGSSSGGYGYHHQPPGMINEHTPRSSSCDVWPLRSESAEPSQYESPGGGHGTSTGMRGRSGSRGSDLDALMSELYSGSMNK